MQITFDDLYDLKEFILMIDIYQFCDKQEAWGGLGYIIQNWYVDPDRKEKIVVDESDQSRVIRRSGDCVIVTPYYKMISWLFDVLRCYAEESDLDTGVFLGTFSKACEEYFQRTPDHSAKELMLNILEQIQLNNDIAHGFYVEK